MVCRETIVMVEGVLIGLDRSSRERIAFYVDIIMFIIVIASVTSIALHSYYSGWFSVQNSPVRATQEMMYVAASVAFLTAAMMWIFIRYFRCMSRRK